MTTIQRILAAYLLLSSALFAQQKLRSLRIEIERDGLHEIRFQDLKSFLSVPSVDADRMRVMLGNMEIPISFRSVNGGRFDRSSSLIFYGEANPSRHTHTGVYRLEFKPGRRRIPTIKSRRTNEVLQECVVEETFEEDLVFDAMRTVNTEFLDLDRSKRAHWFWARIAPPASKPGTPDQNFHSFLLRPSPRPRAVDKTNAKIIVRVRSHLAADVEQTLACDFAGRRVESKTWRDNNVTLIEFEVPHNSLKKANVLTLRNESKIRFWKDAGNQVHKQFSNDILVDSVTLRHRTLLTGPTSQNPQIIYDLVTPESSSELGFLFANTGARRARFYDVSRQCWLEGNSTTAPPRSRRRVIAVDTEGYFQPSRITPWSQRSLLTEREGAEWVCIALDRFQDFVAPLAKHRRAQGLSTYVVSDREIYDSFNGGRFGPEAITKFLENAQAVWKTKPRYLLLVGDSDRDVDWISERDVLPTSMVTTYFNGETACDAMLTGKSPLSVGRIPARREDEVLKIIRRIVDYETKAEPGTWSRRLNFIASEGRFGPMIDSLIEGYTRKLLTDLIPAHFDVTMTYASASSPYLYPPQEFNAKVIDRFNEGALTYTYMGHGYPNGFDQLRIGKKRYPILTVRDLPKIDAGATPPLVTLVACSTAHFDDPKQDCIGELMMRKTGGPLALIGATRISHPFSNSLLSKELVRRLFDGQNPRIGDVLRESQDALISSWKEDSISKLASAFIGTLDPDRLMRDHKAMYVLLGDPATRLQGPRPSLEVTAPNSVKPGESIDVRVSGPKEIDGAKIAITFEVRRDRIAQTLTKVRGGRNANPAAIKRNYEVANNKIILQSDSTMKNGSANCALTLPADLKLGAYVLKATTTGGGGSHVGSVALVVAK